MSAKPCLAAALEYLQLGWSVIPLCTHDHAGLPGAHEQECTTPGKRPLWPWKQYQERRPSEGQVRIFWNRVPDSNVGIVMGPVSNLIGIDVDGPEGIRLLDELADGRIITPTLQFDTPGGGLRYLYQWPKEKEAAIRSLKRQGKEAIRLLGEGSQTVAPPSTHWTGKRYAWRAFHDPENMKVAPCPEWLLDALLNFEHPIAPRPAMVPTSIPSDEATRRARAYLEKCDPAIAGQGGHNQTFKVACKLVKGFGLNQETALELLMTVYNAKCQPPWSEKELRHKVESAAKSPDPEGFLLAMPIAQPPTVRITDAHTSRFKDIIRKPIDWLWRNWIALGKLAVLDGDPGLGKSTMLLDLAARVSNIGIMPDNSHGVSGNVIIMSAEDGPEDTIKPRLEAAGANEDRIINLSHVTIKGEERPIEIPGDLLLIAQKIKDHDARLLIIDPLFAFLYGADANKDQEIRRVLYKLSKIAEKYHCAVICMRHLNKGSGQKAIYRGNSSIGVIGHARTGLLVAEDPDDEHKRILAVSKCNLGPRPQSLRFVLDPVGDVCRIGWCGTSPYNADRLVQAPKSEEAAEAKETARSKIDQAASILQMLLEKNNGRLEVKAAKAELAAAGLTGSTVDRAVRKLHLKVHYETDEEGERRYYWSPKAA